MSKEISSNTCPKTCGMLSTAAIFIAIGIIQLLAGIMLLKSEYVYLLAGTDFTASVSNLIVGCLLGISASSWENKMKRMSVKNVSRRNVLAGLYISVVAINSTTAIIMILGDGNSLLTALAETTRSTSAKFVNEILACAYVTSVCSPIVCIVVGIVCLSGNRLELRDRGQAGKKRNKSVSKSESYGWVFTHRPKLMSDSLQELPSLSRTSLDDCVFLENQQFGNSSKRNPLSSLTEAEKPLKIWAQKRRKILEEITSPRSSVFSDNYLQFPEFTYGSYVETIIPRIKLTSLIRPPSEVKSSGHFKNESKSSDICTSKFSRDSCTCQFSPTKNLYATINKPKKTTNVEADPLKHSGNISKVSLKDCHRPVSRLEYDHEIFQNCPRSKTSVNRSTSQTNQSACGLVRIQCQCEYCNESSNHLSNGNIEDGEDVFDYPDSFNQTNGKRTRSDTHSVSLEFETSDSDSEMNITANPLEYSANRFNDRLKSFKIIGDKAQKQSHNSQNDILKSSLNEEVLPHSKPNSINSPENAMAGKIIPINIRHISSRTNSFPITVDKLGSTETEEIVNGELKNKYRNLYSEISLNDVGLSTNIKQCAAKQEKEINNELECQDLKIKTQKEENFDKCSPTAVSKTKEIYNCENYSTSIKDKTLNDRVSREETTNTQSLVEEFGPLDDDKIRNKKQSAIRFPSIMTGYPIGLDGKTDISNLIMDSDSLLGLSEEELMDRTRRIRKLRKSVEIRSKERKSLTVYTNKEE